MQPSLWGPHVWRALHFIALGYPENPDAIVQAQYRDFYLNFWKFIPCMKCSINYKRHLQEIPYIDTYLQSPKELFQWTWMMHNIVNRELGKPEWDFEKAYEHYQKPIVCDGRASEQQISSDNLTHPTPTTPTINPAFMADLSRFSSLDSLAPSPSPSRVYIKPSTTPNVYMHNIIIAILFMTIVVLLLLIYFKKHI